MALGLCSCVPPDIHLTDEYSLVSVSGRAKILINSENDVMIEENVADAFLAGKFIVGERVIPSNFNPKFHSPVFGCFAINIVTGEVLDGMIKQDFVAFSSTHSLKPKRKIRKLACISSL